MTSCRSFLRHADKKQIREMLDVTVKKGVKPWIQKRPMKDANQTMIDMVDGKARYRYVLVNEAHA